MEFRLVADLATNALVAVAYGFAGYRLWGRAPERHEDDATNLPFAIWWFGLAATAILGALADGLVLVGMVDVAWLGGLSMLTLVAFSLAIGGLVLHTLRPWVSGPLITAAVVLTYTIYDAAEFYVMLSQVPAGTRVDGWRPVLDTTATLNVGFMLATAAGLLLPPIGAAAGYLAVGAMRRSRESTLVGLAMVAWCAGIVLIAVPQLALADTAQALARALVLASGAVLYIAYAGDGQRTDEPAAWTA